MVQYLNEFTAYCRSIGLLTPDSCFTIEKDTLEETLFMYLLTLDRKKLLLLSNRITQIWNTSRPSEHSHRRMSLSELNSKSSSNYLHDQYIQKEENQLFQQQLMLDQKMKECTFKPKITKKGQQLEFSSPAHLRLNKYATDIKIKQQISSEINQKNELKECTFKPSINQSNVSSNENPFDRLYQNALTQRNKTPRNEESQYTYRPQLISSPPNHQLCSEPVGERLYNHHFEKLNNIVTKQEQLEAQKLEECTFTPLINQTNSKQNQVVFDRLYNHSSVKSVSDVKEMSIYQSHVNKKSESLLKNPVSDNNSYVTQFQIEVNPYDRLFSEHQRLEKKKKNVQTQYYSSIPFKPLLNKK